MKHALITGITGQDGSYLAELLLKKHYVVWGLIRRASNFNTMRVDHILDKLNLEYGDLTDMVSILRILNKIKKENPASVEVYNLAAQSHVKVSFDLPLYTGQVDAIGTLNMLEAIRQSELQHVRFYQAGSSEMFGKVQAVPQTETTPFYPRSPYGVAKVYSYWITKNYREAYGMHASNGILFNHESPRRGKTFVTKKITDAVNKIARDPEHKLVLGNLDAKRDWGHAKDYVEAMWMMLQRGKPDDYVIATNETHTVRDFVEAAFSVHEKEVVWSGEGLNEVGTVDGRVVVRVDEKYFRPTEVDLLLGDSSKAERQLGWQKKYTFEKLVEEMIKK